MLVILYTIGLVASVAAVGYSLLALLAVCLGPRRRPSRKASSLSPVTILKPLCGDETELETCLRSFCEQEYPRYQIVFGVQSEEDPALDVARRLRQAYPELEMDIVVDSQLWGTNRKVSNLINMLRVARYDRLVLADSDILVRSDYLRRVIASLEEKGRNALVTCLYRGWSGGSPPSRLGALFIDDWFMPAVLVAKRLGLGSDFVSGATIALHRDTLDAIGGLAAIADQLADDHALGSRVRAIGGSIVLSDYVVAAHVNDMGLAAHYNQEIRWMRTIRLLQPLGYGFLFISLAPPLALLGALIAWGSSATTIAFVVTLAARIALHCLQANRYATWSWKDLWLLPLRDLMNVGIWCLGFVNGSIHWRGHLYEISDRGLLRRKTYAE